MSARSITERLRGWSYWKCSDGYGEGFDSTPFEAADTIEVLQLAGMSVWNNLRNGDIETHTEQAAAS